MSKVDYVIECLHCNNPTYINSLGSRSRVFYSHYEACEWENEIIFPYLSKNVLDLQNELNQIRKQQKFVASSASDQLLASIIQDKLDPIEEGFKLELKEEFEIDLIEEFKIEPIAIKIPTK